MKFSLGKTFWKVYLWLFDIFTPLFLVLDLATFILIILQTNPDFNDFMTLLVPLIIILSVALLVQIFPLWIQAVCLWAYFKFSHWLILNLLSSGFVDYNFTWTLPEWISNPVGLSAKGTSADFIFWSGFILIALLLINQLNAKLLVFLAETMKITWARELMTKRIEKNLKDLKTTEGIIEVSGKKEIRDDKVLSLPLSKERIVFRPKFFKDRLWFLWIMFLSMVFPVLILILLFALEGTTNISDSFYFVFGGTILLTFLIFLPFALWEATTRITLEEDKIIIKTFFFKKTEIYYSDIKNVYVQRNKGLQICYENQTKKKEILKTAQLFPWAFTTEELLKELKPRLENVNINDNFIVNSIKTVKAARSPTTVLTVFITTGLFIGFIYYITNQAENQLKFSDEDCANQLEFWINDKPKIGILETKEGFNPELNIEAPFYLFINVEKNALKCDKNISFAIYNTNEDIVFKEEKLEFFKTGITSYYWEDILKEKGDYLLKANYGGILVQEIDFSVK